METAEWERLAEKLSDAGPELDEAREWVREVLAVAWDEGKHSEHTVECRWGDGDCNCPNPYRD